MHYPPCHCSHCYHKFLNVFREVFWVISGVGSDSLCLFQTWVILMGFCIVTKLNIHFILILSCFILLICLFLLAFIYTIDSARKVLNEMISCISETVKPIIPTLPYISKLCVFGQDVSFSGAQSSCDFKYLNVFSVTNFSKKYTGILVFLNKP